MDIHEHSAFILGEWLVSPEEGVVSRGNDSVRLEPKVMEVLVCLASRPGEVVTREDMEQEVWRGGLVGYDSVTSTVIKLRKALGDSAKDPKYVATIPKRGYQLIAPVRSVEQNASPVTSPSRSALPKAPSTHKRQTIPWLPGLILLILITAIGLRNSIFSDSTSTSSGAQETADISKVGSHHSIIVTPFDTIGNDPQQTVFADGITEDIITDLSGFSDLAVIASNTAFTFKETRLSAKEIGEKLNIDFVLVGSIRREGNDIRVNAQLVNANTGFQIWAKRYDRKVVEVFSVQDEITSSIVQALAVKLTKAEKNRLEQQTTGILAAYDHFLEGQRLSRAGTRTTDLQSEVAYRKAIETDPFYGRAYGALAYTLAYRYRRGWTDSPLQTLDLALDLAKKAVELDSTLPQTYWSLGYVHLMRKEFDQAKNSVRKSLAVSPSHADSYGLLALINNALGESEAAIELINRGKKLNPYYTWDYPYNLGRAYYSLGRIDEAIYVLEEARTRNQNAVPVRLHLAATYARAGRLDDAEWEVEELQVLSPTDTITQVNNAHPRRDDKIFQGFLDDLRKAGLPE